MTTSSQASQSTELETSTLHSPTTTTSTTASPETLAQHGRLPGKSTRPPQTPRSSHGSPLALMEELTSSTMEESASPAPSAQETGICWTISALQRAPPPARQRLSTHPTNK